MTTWSNPAITGESYQYDAVGNRLDMIEPTSSITPARHKLYDYDHAGGPNRLDTVRVRQWESAPPMPPFPPSPPWWVFKGGTAYSYDGNGAVTGLSHFDAGYISTHREKLDYSYRGLTRRWQFETPNPMGTHLPWVMHEDWRYRYNPMGEREQKRVYFADSAGHVDASNLGWVYYLLGGNREQLAMYHGQELGGYCGEGGNRVYMYPMEYNTYGGRLVRMTTRLDTSDPHGAKEYRIADHLGSTRIRLSESGVVTGEELYRPFGESLTFTLKPRLGYIGKETDQENALSDHGVRKYEQGNGRFLSVDPLWEEYRDWTPYHYGMSNPLKNLDYSGFAVLILDKDLKVKWDQVISYLQSIGKYNNDPENPFRSFFILNEDDYFLVTVKRGDMSSQFTYSQYNHETSTLLWDPNGGLHQRGEVYRNGKLVDVYPVRGRNSDVISLFIILMHESDHALRHQADPNGYFADRDDTSVGTQWSNREEQQVIQNTENRIAKKYGEPIRNSHEGIRTKVDKLFPEIVPEPDN